MISEELMIGNNILWKNKIVIVTIIGIHGIECCPIDNTEAFINSKFSTVDLKGIRVTPDILLDAGFERVKPRAGVWKAFIKNGIRINMSNSGNFYYHRWNTVNYVHQLQNLMFVVTGEHLKIQL